MKIFTILLAFLSFNIYSQDKNFINLDESLDSIVIADQAIVEVSIQSQYSTKDSTLIEQNRKVLNVLAVLKNVGYTKDNIYNRSNNFTNGINDNKEIIYIAFQSYRILLKDFNKYDKLKEELIKSGASELKIIQFWKSNFDEIKSSLYQKALINTQKKAELFSNTIGAKAFELNGISDKTEQIKLDDFLLFEDKNRFLMGGVVVEEGELSMSSTKIKISVHLYVTFTFNY